jgi:hypothetical protein
VLRIRRLELSVVKELKAGVVELRVAEELMEMGVVEFWDGVLRIRRLEFSVAGEELRIGVVEFCAANVLRIYEDVL